MKTQWRKLEPWQRAALVHQMGTSAVPRWLMVTVVVLGLLAVGVLLAAEPTAGTTSPAPRRGTNWVKLYLSPTNNVDPVQFRRYHREAIKTPGGAVGIRAELTNLPPTTCPLGVVALQVSTNGKTWDTLPIERTPCGRAGVVRWCWDAVPQVELYRLAITR